MICNFICCQSSNSLSLHNIKDVEEKTIINVVVLCKKPHFPFISAMTALSFYICSNFVVMVLSPSSVLISQQKYYNVATIRATTNKQKNIEGAHLVTSLKKEESIWVWRHLCEQVILHECLLDLAVSAVGSITPKETANNIAQHTWVKSWCHFTAHLYI